MLTVVRFTRKIDIVVNGKRFVCDSLVSQSWDLNAKRVHAHPIDVQKGGEAKELAAGLAPPGCLGEG